MINDAGEARPFAGLRFSCGGVRHCLWQSMRPLLALTTAAQRPGSDLRTARRTAMSVNFGRFARALLLAGGIATAIALPALVGTPLMPANEIAGARRARRAGARTMTTTATATTIRPTTTATSGTSRARSSSSTKGATPPEELAPPAGWLGARRHGRRERLGAHLQRPASQQRHRRWRLRPHAGRVRRARHLRRLPGERHRRWDGDNDNDNDDDG